MHGLFVKPITRPRCWADLWLVALSGWILPTAQWIALPHNIHCCCAAQSAAGRGWERIIKTRTPAPEPLPLDVITLHSQQGISKTMARGVLKHAGTAGYGKETRPLGCVCQTPQPMRSAGLLSPRQSAACQRLYPWRVTESHKRPSWGPQAPSRRTRSARGALRVSVGAGSVDPVD